MSVSKDRQVFLFDRHPAHPRRGSPIDIVRKRRTLLREVNEEIRRTGSGFAPDGESYLMLCECERSDCLNRLTVPAVVYDEARRDRDRFLVIAGHEDPGVERLVTGDEYCVVRVPPPVLEFNALNSLPAA